jgi:hypothetical protein
MTSKGNEDWSVIYAVLASDERRDLLQYLTRVPEASLEDVIQGMFKKEDEPTKPEVDAIRLRLYHVHIPKLAEAGLLTWDAQAERVALTARGARLPTHMFSPDLSVLPQTEDREPAVE